MTYFGYTGSSSGLLTVTSGNVWGALVQNNAGGGNITEIGIYIDDYDTGGNARFGIYAVGTDYQPGALLLDAGEVTIGVGDKDTWKTITGLSFPVTNGTYYWISITTNFDCYLGRNDNQTGFHFSRGPHVYGALPNPFPEVAYENDDPMMCRAGVEAGGGATNVVYMIFES